MFRVIVGRRYGDALCLRRLAIRVGLHLYHAPFPLALDEPRRVTYPIFSASAERTGVDTSTVEVSAFHGSTKNLRKC